MNHTRVMTLCIVTALFVTLATAGCASLVSVLPLPAAPTPPITPIAISIATSIPTATPAPTETPVAAAAPATPTPTPVAPEALPATGRSNASWPEAWVFFPAAFLAFGYAWYRRSKMGR